MSGCLKASDDDADPLTYAIVDDPSNGTISNLSSSDGSFTYTPDPDYCGTDSFTYKVNDGTADSNIATANIVVNCQADAPVITESSPVTVTMSEDGSPTPFSLTLHATDADTGDTLTWSISDQPASGTGTATASGTGLAKSIGYTPPANWYGTTVFTVAVSDSTLSDTVAVSVTVQSVNDVPAITESSPVAVTMSEDGDPTPFSLTLHATDADTGDTLTWSIANQPASGTGTATASGTGLTKSIGYTPPANWHGTAVFTVAVSDGLLNDAVAVNVTVQSVNDAPVAVDDTAMVRRDDSGELSILTVTPITIPVLINDSDPVDGVTDNSGLTVSAVGAGSQGGTVSINTNGLWVDYAPTATFTGTETFTYTVQDGGGLKDTATVTVTVVNGDSGGSTIPGDNGGKTIVIPNTGTNNTMTVTVQIPAGISTDTVTLVYNKLDAAVAPPPQGFKLAGLSFTLDAYLNQVLQPGHVFSTPITLTVEYSDADIADIKGGEDTLDLRYWDGSNWSSDGITIIERDTANNRLVVSIAHLTEFALFGRDTIHIYYLPIVAKN